MERGSSRSTTSDPPAARGSLDEMSVEELSINTIRTLAMDAVQAADSGHPGTPMALAPLGYTLFTRHLRYNPDDPEWFDRDRFVLSAGHASMLQYALLHLVGYGLSLEEIRDFRQWGSLTPGHPEAHLTPGVETTTGPLGQGISNAVEATSKEENIHGMFGIDVINIIKDEHPEWFDAECNEMIIEACREAYEAEAGIIDWIFEAGELDFMPAQNVKEFVKHRFNNSLAAIGLPRIFEVSEALLEETEWFDAEVIATKHVDFFQKRSINYNKRSASVTSDDLF